MRVSIVIAGVSGDRAVERCTGLLRRAAENQDLEILVLRGDPDSVFQLRWRGIMQASGERVAVLGDRYQATPRWLKEIAEVDAEAAAGCIAPAASLNYWGWCVYLSEYAHVAPPVTDGPALEPKQAPGGNVLYSASVLGRWQPAASDTDLSFHARLMQAGVNFQIGRALEVEFASAPGFSEYIRERFWLSRKIGSDGGARKLLVAPLLPFVVLFRVASAVCRKRRYIGRFLACAPAIFLLGIVQAAGESAGALSRTHP